MLATCIALPAVAQDWVTRELCAVTDAGIDSAALTDALLSELQPKADQIANGVGRFWRIESPTGAVSHLWGTFHSSNPLILDLPDAVEQAIADARVVALEIDPIRPNRAAIKEDLAYTGLLRQGGSATWQFQPENTGIPAEIIARVRERTEAMGWGAEAPDYLTLGGLANLLLYDACEDFVNGVIPIQDSRIQMLGMIAGAETLGLEPVDAFVEHLNAPANRRTALSLITLYGSYLEPAPGLRQTYFSLYLQGRVGLMMAFEENYVATQWGEDGLTHLDRTDAFMLDKRNLDFLATALPELEQGGVFMAVGAYHLPGPGGMVALLRKAGYTLTRMPLPGEAS